MMSNIRTFASISIPLIFGLLSCTTPGTGVGLSPPQRAEQAEKSVRMLLDDNNPYTALMYIDKYRVRDGWDDKWLTEYETEAAAQIREDFQSSLQTDAAARITSLLQILPHLNSETEFHSEEDLRAYQIRVAQMEFQHEYDNERFPTAIAAFLRMLQYEIPGDEVLEQGFTIIDEFQDIYAYITALERLQDMGVETDDLEERFQVESVPASQQVPGVATVWVNKGIRLQDGVGRPDRMIGSGFFIDRQGHLITNYHVIQSEVDPKYEGYSRVYIRPHEAPETRIPAQVVGFDPILDLALLKVPYTPEYVFPISGVRERQPGSRVYAIGSPGGLSNTITSGIISAGGRRFLQLGEAVQVDAPLNPGNSGGPVLDDEGNLVGVVYAGIPQFSGITFAVPSFWLRGILGQLYDEGRVAHAFIGVSIHESKQGLEVTHVITGSPADTAGIRVGDRITAINGKSIETLSGANRQLQDVGADQLIQLEILTEVDGSRIPVRQRLVTGTRSQRPLEASLKGVSDFPADLFPPLFGMYVSEIRSGWFSSDYTVDRVLTGSIADEVGLSDRDPFTFQRWEYDEEEGIVALFIQVRKRQSGYMDSSFVLPVFIETSDIL